MIPIRDSVKMLDDEFPHLRDIRWNDKTDEEENVDNGENT